MVHKGRFYLHCGPNYERGGMMTQFATTLYALSSLLPLYKWYKKKIQPAEIVNPSAKTVRKDKSDENPPYAAFTLVNDV